MREQINPRNQNTFPFKLRKTICLEQYSLPNQRSLVYLPKLAPSRTLEEMNLHSKYQTKQCGVQFQEPKYAMIHHVLTIIQTKHS
jgi:hypothetical protein